MTYDDLMDLWTDTVNLCFCGECNHKEIIVANLNKIDDPEIRGRYIKMVNTLYDV